MKPSIFVFNPTGEMAIANSTVSYQAPKHLQEFETRLAYLAAFLANDTDQVLIYDSPARDFLDFWEAHNIKLPTSYNINTALSDLDFIKQPKNKISPWCWSPAMHHKLKALKEYCSESFLQQPNSFWKPEHKLLYGRAMALDILKQTQEKLPDKLCLPPKKFPTVCHTEKQVEQILCTHKKIVLKAPWSSSGRGVQVLRQSLLNTSVCQWIRGTIKQQGYVMAEPLLDKVADLGFQFKIENRQLDYLGASFFATNSNGLYQGNLVNQFPNWTTETQSFFFAIEQEISSQLEESLKNSPIFWGYEGYFGIDALLFQENGELRIQPCLEINLRYNMGTLAMKLQEKIHPEAKGTFRIYIDKKQSFSDYVQKQNKTQLLDNKAIRGFFPLSPIKNSPVGAFLQLK